MTVLFIPIPGLGRYIATRPDIIRALYPWARRVEARAKTGAPKKSGRLQRSIHIVPTPTALRVVADARNKGFNYSGIQEARRPYLRPAIRK